MKISNITEALEKWAPLSLQEGYDNSGLIIGDPNMEVTGILVTLDCIEAIVDEAIEKGCNLIVAHHPIVFSGLKKINGKNYIERTVIKAIKNDIAIYAIHTNLDNVSSGVNYKIAQLLGLKHLKPLDEKRGLLKKLVVFCPISAADQVKNALFESGAGAIGNYDECSFELQGNGSFKANKEANPFVGEIGKRHIEPEARIEVIFESFKQNAIMKAMMAVHPYEEVAYDLYAIENSTSHYGSGLVGDLEEEIDEVAFIAGLKATMKTQCVRHTAFLNKNVKRVAVCGGAGSFLLNNAIRSGAQCFITGDFKYHQFFDADNKIVIADIGHYESEQFTIQLISDFVVEKFPTFAVHLSQVNTNPVNYS